MTRKEIEKYRQKLAEIINRPKQEDGNPAKGSKEDLQKLAQQVGASTRAIYTHPTKGRIIAYDAGISDLIDNIHQALQTATMVNMCETSNKNYEIASRATKIAFGSAIAAWAAVLGNVLIAILAR